MGGTIAARSQVGIGSTFEVTRRLPVTEQEAEAAAAPQDVAAAFEAALTRFGRPVRILFAEDNTTNQFVARQLLRGFDVQVDMVAKFGRGSRARPVGGFVACRARRA